MNDYITAVSLPLKIFNSIPLAARLPPPKVFCDLSSRVKLLSIIFECNKHVSPYIRNVCTLFEPHSTNPHSSPRTVSTSSFEHTPSDKLFPPSFALSVLNRECYDNDCLKDDYRPTDEDENDNDRVSADF